MPLEMAGPIGMIDYIGGAAKGPPAASWKALSYGPLGQSGAA